MQSTEIARPGKPYPDFPLFPHASGRWAKKIRGRFHYFGHWRGDHAATWEQALARYQRDRDYLHAGVPVPAAGDEPRTVADTLNEWLADAENRVGTGELGRRQFDEYLRVAKEVVAALGRLTPVAGVSAADTSRLRTRLAKGRALTTLDKYVRIARMMLSDGLPGKSLEGLKVVRKAKLRVDRNSRRTPLSTQQIRTLLAAADTRMKACILLALNGGLGNTDLAQLRVDNLDLDARWLDLPRTKTGTDRRIPLWPETVAAIRDYLAERKHDDDLVFRTRRGEPLVRDLDSGNHTDALTLAFRKLRDSVGLEQHGLGFYQLRRCFKTIAENKSRDHAAVEFVMGHTRGDVDAAYFDGHEDSRLRDVVESVRSELFG